jgi:hypothetical protein
MNTAFLWNVASNSRTVLIFLFICDVLENVLLPDITVHLHFILTIQKCGEFQTLTEVSSKCLVMSQQLFCWLDHFSQFISDLWYFMGRKWVENDVLAAKDSQKVSAFTGWWQEKLCVQSPFFKTNVLSWCVTIWPWSNMVLWTKHR